MTAPHRLAIYWAPEAQDPLHALGSRWLGRDAESGAALLQPALPGHDIAAITATARDYGLHATLKPPFRPNAPAEAVLEAARALLATVAPFDLPPLAVADLGGFLALRETAPCPALHALADRCVEALDGFRTPPSPDELAKRRGKGLSAEQDALLLRWGYPHVFSHWRFHVTLTRRLDVAERTVIRPAAENFLGDAAGQPRRVAGAAVFAQPVPGAPFHILARLPLGTGTLAATHVRAETAAPR